MINEEAKKLIDFFHYNTTNYSHQLLFEKGKTYGYKNNINNLKHPKDIISNMKFKQKDILPTLHSRRDMKSTNPIERTELLNLLYHTYRFEKGKNLKAPSPGGIYPLELYIVIKNVVGVDPGVYIYNRETISLSYINNYCDISALNVPNNEFTKNVGCMIFFVCNIKNIMDKYGARAYRHCLIECGHIGQNLSIVSNQLDIKSCAIGGFYDSKVRKSLNISDNFYPLYAYVLGG